jgi:hypothetical protein
MITAGHGPSPSGENSFASIVPSGVLMSTACMGMGCDLGFETGLKELYLGMPRRIIANLSRHLHPTLYQEFLSFHFGANYELPTQAQAP